MKTLIECNEELLSKCHAIKQQLLEVIKDQQKVQSQLQVLSRQVMNETILRDDDKKVKYFTGLPSFSVLRSIYNLTTKGLSESADCSLFDQYLLTLVKLQLNTGDTDLACRFGIRVAYQDTFTNGWIHCIPDFHFLSIGLNGHI